MALSPDKSLPTIVWPSLPTLTWEKRFRLSYLNNLPSSASRPCNPLMDSCESENRTCPPQTSAGPFPKPTDFGRRLTLSAFCVPAPMSAYLPNRTCLRCRKNGMSLIPKGRTMSFYRKVPCGMPPSTHWTSLAVHQANSNKSTLKLALRPLGSSSEIRAHYSPSARFYRYNYSVGLITF